MLIGAAGPSDEAVAAAALAQLDTLRWRDADQPSPWSPASRAIGFRLNARPQREVRIDGEGGPYTVRVLESGGEEHAYLWRLGVGGRSLSASVMFDSVVIDDDRLGLRRDGAQLIVFDAGQAFRFGEPDYEHGAGEAAGDGAVVAPMPGRIVSVEAAAGQAVVKGAKLVTLEAMKMEHGLTAPFDGVVAEVNATAGAQVSEGTVLVRLEPAG
jgi:propionyl-CoA carboxylase alpha chain/3-methylcrotonyl-CoA carboxylase alpha subunit